MSKIEAEQLSNIAGDRIGLVAGIVRGFAKVWANLNGTGTIALRDSENISSVVDNGTGNYAFNLTNAFGALNYSFVTDGDNGVTTAIKSMSYYSSSSASAMIVLTSNAAGNAVTDFSYVSVIAHGDLA